MENIVNTDVYSFYVDAIIKSDLNKNEQEEYNKAAIAYSNCFMLAKENKIFESQEIYKVILLINEKSNPILSQWVILLCGPRLAYYYYKTKNYTEAIAYTQKIIQCIETFFFNGYEYLFFLKIQQLHNLSRIFFALNDFDEAVHLCIKCLSTIVNQSSKWETKKIINKIQEIELIKKTQYDMIIQVAAETCDRLIQKFKDDPLSLNNWMGIFLEPVTKLNFNSVSQELRYKNIDVFFLLMQKFLKEGIEDVNESDLLTLKAPDADRYLLNILYKFATMLNNRVNGKEIYAIT